MKVKIKYNRLCGRGKEKQWKLLKLVSGLKLFDFCSMATWTRSRFAFKNERGKTKIGWLTEMVLDTSDGTLNAYEVDHKQFKKKQIQIP
jgi:hypothetical protein